MLNRNYLKFAISFLVIVAVVGGGIFVWNEYFSPEAKTQRNYQKYLDWQANYEKAMREDTYGGKTPQETLDLFVAALKKGDVELASKYFVLDTNEQPYNEGNYLTRNKILEILNKEKQDGKFSYIAEMVSQAVPDLSQLSKEDYLFVVYEKGEIITEISMKLNKYSNIWKIESL